MTIDERIAYHEKEKRIKLWSLMEFGIACIIFLMIMSINYTSNWSYIVVPLSLLDACIFTKAYKQLTIKEFWEAVVG